MTFAFSNFRSPSMSIPSLLLAFLIASLYGVVFFLLSGRTWVELALYWATAVIGFAIGALLSRFIGLNLLPIGEVNIIEASITSLVALVLARILWRRRQ